VNLSASTFWNLTKNRMCFFGEKLLVKNKCLKINIGIPAFLPCFFFSV
jgi:hypothetical protein